MHCRTGAGGKGKASLRASCGSSTWACHDRRLAFCRYMKDGERVSLRLAGDGPLGAIVADAEGTSVRVMWKTPASFCREEWQADVGGGVGSGMLSVTRFLANAELLTESASSWTERLPQILQTIFIRLNRRRPACAWRHVRQGRRGYGGGRLVCSGDARLQRGSSGDA